MTSLCVTLADPRRRAFWESLARENRWTACRCRRAGDPTAKPSCPGKAVVLADPAELRPPLREALQRLRRAGCCSSLLLTTPKAMSPAAVIEGLDAGADDCLSDSLDRKILTAKLRAHVRRAASSRGLDETTLSSPSGSLRLDPQTRMVSTRIAARGWAELARLTRNESLLLTCILRAPGVVFERSTLLDMLRREDGEIPLPNAVDKLVQNLRRKLGAKGRLIRTVYGSGYALAENA